jgi:hypothetical protein
VATYIFEEFKNSKFERDNEPYDGGSSMIEILTKDEKRIAISVYGRYINIDGKQYVCHSYLTNYVRSFKYYD